MAHAPYGRIAVVNAERVDFDGALDWGALERGPSDDDPSFVVERHASSSAEEIVARAAGCVAVVTKEIALSAHTIAALPDSVRLICEAGTGYNNIALDAAAARGITVCNVPQYSTDAVAQLVITFVLALSCGLVQQQRMLLRGDRSNFTHRLQVPHFELAGKTIGLVGGSGLIGQRVAELARALGMRVLVSSRRAGAPGAPPGAVTLDELLAASDFVSVHCPLTDETRGLLGAAAFRRMKRGAYLVNTARGAVVCEEALLGALRAGELGGAALDVQECEPPPPDSPLYSEPGLILTPHIGWRRLETRQRLLGAVGENARAFARGAPINVVSAGAA